jgi:hypothetical protein
MKIISALVIALTLSFTSAAPAAEISGLAWNRANIAALRSSDKNEVATFLNEQRKEGLPQGIPFEALTARDIDGFGWADPQGNGHYQLLVASSGRCAHSVTIYNRDASGRVTTAQVLPQPANLRTGIRDLNGDGKDELIVGETLVEHSCATVITWPAVYRFQNSKYVEAGRDFPTFYDNEVLPQLSTLILKYQGGATGLTEDLGAGPIMERDKILRVLGRDSTAGLNQAYQWMKTDDPYLLQDAEVTFKDIGGHEKEAIAAESKSQRATCERHPDLAMCRNANNSKSAGL